MPLCASPVAGPSVNTQFVAVPSWFFTEMVNDPWGFTNFMDSTDPEISESLAFVSYTPAREIRASKEPLAVIPNKAPHIRVRFIIVGSPSDCDRPAVRLYHRQCPGSSSR